MIRNILFLAVTVFALVSCNTGLDGNLKDNLPPKTFLTVNSINLPEGERLNSQIRISWWGDDPDGYVVGYEIHIGDNPQDPSAVWTFTSRTDSTFVLPISEGSITADVKFSVRAIDNDDDRDPEPPNLVFPIENSPPTIRFAAQETPPDTTYSVFTFGIRAADPDGNANLNRIEIALNGTSDSDWRRLPPNAELITFIVDENESAKAYTGRSLLPTDIAFDNIQWNADNRFYVRSIDNAGAVSQVVTHEWFVKRQTSRVLFLNDYFGPNSQSTAALHLDLLRSVGFSQVDYIDISDGTSFGGQRVQLTAAFPNRTLAAPTINTMLAQWDHIYWISDNLDRNIGYALEITFDFFQNGGTMFVNIPSKVLFDDNPILEFLPFERVQPVPQGQQSFIVQNNAEVSATSSVPNAPYLRFRRNLLAVHPIIPFGETVELFSAPFKTRSPISSQAPRDFTGSNLISAMNPEQTILFFGIDLTEFDTQPREVTVSGERVTLPASDLSRLIEFTTRDILRFEQ